MTGWTCKHCDLNRLCPKKTPRSLAPRCSSVIGENRQLVTDEPVEFANSPVEVQDCRKITDKFRGIYGIYPNLLKENRRMSTCNRLDLQTLGSQPVMPNQKSPQSLNSTGYG